MARASGPPSWKLKCDARSHWNSYLNSNCPSFPSVGVDGPRRHRMCQSEGVEISNQGAVHVRDYPNWHRHVQECFPVAWSECERSAGFEKEAEAVSACALVGEAGADEDRHRSLRWIALSGAHAESAGARGGSGAAAICQTLCCPRQE